MRTKVIAAAVGVVLLLGGCAAVDREDAADAATTPVVAVPASAQAVHGSWSVRADGDAETTELRLRQNEIVLVRPCGEVWGSWKLGEAGVFVADISGTKRCDFVQGEDPTPAWLDGANRLVVTGHGLTLLRDKAPVAQLRRAAGQVPRPVPTAPASEPSSQTLPAGLRAADRDDLLATWLPVATRDRGAGLDDPFLHIRADGSFRGSDGCNATGGSWRYVDARLTVIGGIQTEIGCANVPVGDWFVSARHAAFDGRELVLLSDGMNELGRLVEGVPRCEQREQCAWALGTPTR